MPTALITGAARGIGSAIAAALAPSYTLLLAGRPSDRLDAVADRFDATTFPLDLTDADTALSAARRGTICNNRSDGEHHVIVLPAGSGRSYKTMFSYTIGAAQCPEGSIGDLPDGRRCDCEARCEPAPLRPQLRTILQHAAN